MSRTAGSLGTPDRGTQWPAARQYLADLIAKCPDSTQWLVDWSPEFPDQPLRILITPTEPVGES